MAWLSSQQFYYALLYLYMVYMRSDGECCAYIDRGVKHKVRQRFGKIEYSNNNNNNDDDHRQWQPNRMNTSTAQSAHEAIPRRQLFCHRPQWMLNAKCILKLHEINKLPVAFLCVRINHESMVHYDVNYFGAYRMICWSANRKCCPMISLFCCFIFRCCCFSAHRQGSFEHSLLHDKKTHWTIGEIICLPEIHSPNAAERRKNMQRTQLDTSEKCSPLIAT